MCATARVDVCSVGAVASSSEDLVLFGAASEIGEANEVDHALDRLHFNTPILLFLKPFSKPWLLGLHNPRMLQLFP